MGDTVVLGTSEGRWPDKDEGPWTLRLAFGLVDGRAAVVGVELYAVDPKEIRRAAAGWPKVGYVPATAPGITSTGLRVPLGERLTRYLADTVRSDSIISNAPTMRPEWREFASKRLEQVQEVTCRRGPGRPPMYGREHYERVASVYLNALWGEDHRHPTLAVKRHFMVSSATAAKWVAKARQMGLLPPTVKGKAAGWSSDHGTRAAKKR